MKVISIKQTLLGIISLLDVLVLQAQRKTDQELLIGKWVAIDDTHSTIEFTREGKCYIDYVSVEDNIHVHDIYTYTLLIDGNDYGLPFINALLVDTHDRAHTLNYILSVGENHLQLEYTEPVVGTDFYTRVKSSR